MSAAPDRPTSPHATSLHAALARAAAGLEVGAVPLPPRARRALAVARSLGAPRAPALRAALTAAEQAEELLGAVAVAAAEGRTVARALVVAPPVLGPVTALLVTDQPFAVWHTPTGRVVLGMAAALWVCGGLAVRLLVRGATRPPRPRGDGPTDELLDLVGVALSAGVGLPAAVRTAGGALGPGAACGAAAAALWLELGARGPAPRGWEEVGAALAAARRDGVPMAGLARSLARARRRAQHQLALERAARLGARLTLPTTLLLLPAALLLVAAPVLHGALGALG